MGEKYITIRALFKDEKAATAIRKPLRDFFDECKAAYDFWQDERMYCMTAEGRTRFYRDLRLKFRNVYAYLDWRFAGQVDKVDPLNGLVGVLGWADTCSRRRFEWDGTFFQYVSEVWSGSETDAICVYLRAKFGATHAWALDEKSPRIATVKRRNMEAATA